MGQCLNLIFISIHGNPLISAGALEIGFLQDGCEQHKLDVSSRTGSSISVGLAQMWCYTREAGQAEKYPACFQAEVLKKQNH